MVAEVRSQMRQSLFALALASCMAGCSASPETASAPSRASTPESLFYLAQESARESAPLGALLTDYSREVWLHATASEVFWLPSPHQNARLTDVFSEGTLLSSSLAENARRGWIRISFSLPAPIVVKVLVFNVSGPGMPHDIRLALREQGEAGEGWSEH